MNTPGLLHIPPIPTGLSNPVQPLPEAAGQPQMNATYPVEPGTGAWNDFDWSMISLGLEEPLPIQEVVDEL